MTKDNSKSPGQKFETLIAIMARLRAPDGCPWDREQTHETLRQYLLEEAYEVLEAIDSGDAHHLQEELGDLLLQTIFHAQIAAERGAFEISDVVEAISDKLIRRHPNVFGDVEINSAAEQSVNWEKIKKQEGKSSTIDGVPKALSALLRAWRIQQKASTVGFDWPETKPVWAKVLEELDELKEACENENPDNIEEEFGDLMFSMVNLSRFINVNPEDALRKTIKKFSQRFKQVEAHFEAANRNMSEATLQEMDELWEKAKRQNAR
ncbi:MAG: nucleoside triphosphate pyrophosphohydrolase [Caldithrix sp.]|nr:MAG: nucleoside triphosphate pyrophosphohydrolase [Caldithrix sp.]